MTWLGRLRAYYAHDDPAAETGNFVALVVGWNGPFYPLYVIAIAGRHSAALAPLTMLATPLFLALPWLSRRSSRAARFGLVLVGTANTLWCIKLLGEASGVVLFLLPCAALATLLFRRREQTSMLTAVALPLAAWFIPASIFGAALIRFNAAELAGLHTLNAASALVLTAVLAVQFSRLLQRVARLPGPMPSVGMADSA
ncbi:MAG TPA: hypothetical protein VGG99_18565 [Acetobacteraceae bacterium]